MYSGGGCVEGPGYRVSLLYTTWSILTDATLYAKGNVKRDRDEREEESRRGMLLRDKGVEMVCFGQIAGSPF